MRNANRLTLLAMTMIVVACGAEPSEATCEQTWKAVLVGRAHAEIRGGSLELEVNTADTYPTVAVNQSGLTGDFEVTIPFEDLSFNSGPHPLNAFLLSIATDDGRNSALVQISNGPARVDWTIDGDPNSRGFAGGQFDSPQGTVRFARQSNMLSVTFDSNGEIFAASRDFTTEPVSLAIQVNGVQSQNGPAGTISVRVPEVSISTPDSDWADTFECNSIASVRTCASLQECTNAG